MQKQICAAFSICLAAIVVFQACHAAMPDTQKTTVEGQLLAFFPIISQAPDTVHFFLTEPSTADTVPASLLKACLGSKFESLHFDTGEPQFRALGKYTWTPGVEACVLETTEFWFGKKTLLCFDVKSRRFLHVLEVANFYGGDGGQTATESWWFSTSQPPRIFVKNADHGFSMHGDADPTEYLRESGTLLEWGSTGFQTVASPDSSLLIKNLQMHRTW